MPERSGQQLAQEIAGFHPTVKAVFMTGFANDVDLDQLQLVIAPSLLQKPVTAEALLEAVRAQQHRALPTRGSDM